jgi:DNA-binding response OmpR family regulator
VAYRTAHTLAGTLGTFGLNKAMRSSRKLEQYLHCDLSFSSHSIPHLQALVNALQQEIAATSTIQSLSQPSPTTLPLLIVGCDPDFADTLESVASQQSFDTEIFPTISHAQNWLDNLPQPPVGLILRLLDTLPTKALQFLQQFKQRYPSAPTVIISNQDNLSERLEVARHGGTCFLPKTVTPEQVWVAIAQHIQQTFELTRLTRVMIVDDDPILLKTLPTQLQSWGFEVSTLNDPQQFWNVLEAIHPDVLVLDVQMPQVNGLELCQVLRSDSHWQQLPVLFLSIFADASTQNQAFAVGADDYLCKPIAGIDLAKRIRNRLQRVRTWAR